MSVGDTAPELAADPFVRCYVHDGGLPRVDEHRAPYAAAGARLVLMLTVYVCPSCRANLGPGAIRKRLQAQYETAVSMIGKLGR